MSLLSTYDNDIWLKQDVYKATYQKFTKQMKDKLEVGINTHKIFAEKLQLYNRLKESIERHNTDSDYKDIVEKLYSKRPKYIYAKDMNERNARNLRKAILSPEITSKEFFDDKRVTLTANSYSWDVDEELGNERGGACVIAPHEVDFKISIAKGKLVATKEKLCDSTDQIVKALKSTLSRRVAEIAETIFTKS